MGCIRYLMMKIDILWLCSKMTPLWPIFQERYLKSVLWFSKGWCYNLYAYRKKEIFFTPAAKYIQYNFRYIIFSNVILFHVFKFHIAAMHTQFFNDIFSIYGICIYIYVCVYKFSNQYTHTYIRIIVDELSLLSVLCILV